LGPIVLWYVLCTKHDWVIRCYLIWDEIFEAGLNARLFSSNVWFGMSYGTLYCVVFVISTSMILPFLGSSDNCKIKSCVSICINY